MSASGIARRWESAIGPRLNGCLSVMNTEIPRGRVSVNPAEPMTVDLCGVRAELVPGGWTDEHVRNLAGVALAAMPSH